MPAIGSNIRLHPIKQFWDILEKLMGRRRNSTRKLMACVNVDAATDAGTGTSRAIQVLAKAGAPATNTAADAPTGRGDLCVDVTNSDVYVCTAYTNTTTFTWTKVWD
jgi:hypothetical protein